MKPIRPTLLTAFCCLAIGTSQLCAQSFQDDFSAGYNGWSGDFADYPLGDSVFYQLEFTRAPLPAPLPGSQYGLKIKGSNHSDDLFMFLKKRFSGLQPNTTYQVTIAVDFASKAPTRAFGVGGAPGEGVTLKAGVTLTEPLKIPTLKGDYRMNIDKANQAQPGTDMDTIGHVGVTDTTTVFTLIHRSNATHPFTITTDATGAVWVCIGTDSGFEALTELYYKEIKVVFSSPSRVHQPESEPLLLYPNPVKNTLNIQYGQGQASSGFQVLNAFGQVVRKVGAGQTQLQVADLTPSMYFLSAGSAGSAVYKFVKE